jgi:four helix bundle protein
VGSTVGPSSVSNLRIWHEGMALVSECYKLTAVWPKSELFGLTGQVRRASVSIPCNLAEGRGRGSNAEMARFGQIALGSIYELDTLLQIATELGFSETASISLLRDRLSSLSRQLSSFISKRKVTT